MDSKYSNLYETTKHLYEDVIQRGKTFTSDMGEEIQKELEKMKKQRDEWIKSHEKKETEK